MASQTLPKTRAAGRPPAPPTHAHEHDHPHPDSAHPGDPAPDLAQRMQAAEQLCLAHGARFTPIRREVYRALAENPRPVAAYDLLARLTARTGKQLAPPTIYRALDFLLEIGLAHRLESGNAWLACSHPGPAHDGVYLVCEDCGTTREIEVPAAVASLRQAAAATGFTTRRMVIELAGVCGDCRTAA